MVLNLPFIQEFEQTKETYFEPYQSNTIKETYTFPLRIFCPKVNIWYYQTKMFDVRNLSPRNFTQIKNIRKTL